MANNKYDIFISYRRDGGAQFARILQLMLVQRGYRVFLDYDELTDGIFSDQVRNAIREAPVFMLVLSKDAMKRCVNKDDWVRQEIMLAAELDKHFVPVNPDNQFNGVPQDVPEVIKTVAESHQHSEIGFGQVLGISVDNMIEKRLVPTLGKRSQSNKVDVDYDAAQETLKRIDARNKFVKRATIAGVIGVVLIALAAAFWFWNHNKEKEEFDTLRIELEKKYSRFGLHLSPDLSLEQMNAVGDILSKMTVVKPDTLWMSKFECTVGQWYGILGGDYDEKDANLPITDVSYGDVYMTFIMHLQEITAMDNSGVAMFDLPTAEEWEGAAHGGANNETTLYVGSDNPDEVAWYRDNSDARPHPSDGQQDKEPNYLDLFDMSGNVSEITKSPFGSSNGKFTLCGGNFCSPVSAITASSRVAYDPNTKADTIGFRLIIRRNEQITE